MLLRDTKIVLLDEATSNLDSDLEEAIRLAIQEIMKQREITVLAIAHRVSFLRDASRILVLADGRIREERTFEHLNAR